MIHKSIPVLCNPRKFEDRSAVPGISFHKHSWSIRYSCRTTETLAAPFIKTTGGPVNPYLQDPERSGNEQPSSATGARHLEEFAEAALKNESFYKKDVSHDK